MMREKIRKIAVLLVVVVASLSSGLQTSAAGSRYLDFAMALNHAPPPGSKFRPDLEAELVRLANAYRAGERRKPLKADQTFLLAARAHAADMMINNFMGHRASTGEGFETRMTAFDTDVRRFGRIGENAARDTQKGAADAAKARRLFQQWIDSRPHRKNLRNGSFVYVSTGVIQRGNKIWAVQIFYGAPSETKGWF